MGKNVAAVILAAGSGSRMGLKVTKQRLYISGKSVIRRAAEAFDRCEEITSITVVVRDGEIEFAKEELRGIEKIKGIVVGGDSRAASAKIGFDFAKEDADYIAIHDGARCLITPAMISAVVEDAVKYGAATASSRITDTVKTCDGTGTVLSTLNRDELRLVQTPQIFRTDLYEKALSKLDSLDASYTDDNMLLEAIGANIHCTDTGKSNIKITEKEDLPLAEFLVNYNNNGENCNE